MKIFNGENFFVYGGGVSGKSAARAIKKRGGKAYMRSDGADGFTAPPEKTYRAAIISPGIRHDHAVYDYCKSRGIATMGEVELGFRLAKCKTVGVTGTNGKTTTTRLIAAMIGGTACGNIGYPMTTAIEVERKALAVELSSFQLKDARISPDVAVITNIATDHIDWHGSAEDYYKCKCNIASEMSGTLVLGEDITIGALDSLSTSAKILRCSTTGAVDGAYIEDDYFKFMGERVCPVAYLRLPGRHNLKNALCAIAAAKSMGVQNVDILKAMSAAVPDSHRIEPVGSACGKKWIDDSKATNVSACLAAIDSISGKICLIVGGRDKDLDFDELFSALPESVTEIIAMGESAESIRKSADKLHFERPLYLVRCLSDAVQKAAECSADTVLLSPCCASFDEFKSYAERGERFKSEVIALRGKR